MGNVTEKEIIAFAFEFLKEVCKTDEELLYFSDYAISWEKRKKKIDFRELLEVYSIDELDSDDDIITDSIFDITKYGEKAKRFIFGDEPELEADPDDDSIALLFTEGNIFETLYYYEGFGSGGKKARSLYNALNRTAGKYGMIAGLDRMGIVSLYEPDSD